MNFEELVVSASDLLQNLESYQRTLGRYSNEVIDEMGYKSLKEFSERIAENCGIKRSPSTLRNYAWTYKKIEQYDLPEDLPFSLCQDIARRDDPEVFVKMIRDGMSPTEVRKAIFDARLKENPKKVKEVTCPKCDYTFTYEPNKKI